MRFNWNRFIKQQILFTIIYYGLFHVGEAHSASLVLSVAGAAIGTMFGAPQLGFMIGGMIGNYFFSPTQHIQGPQLTDLKVQSNTNGAPIPCIYGAQAVYGQIIDSCGIQIQHHRDKQGKGGPKAESDYDTATLTFAVSFGEGPLQLRRVWLNETLYVDYSSGNSGSVGDYAKYITFYQGTEDQEPDPSLQAYHGMDLTPAYKGLAYMVFKDLPLANFGNQVPQVKAEVMKTNNAQTNSTHSYVTYPYDNSTDLEIFTNPLNNDIILIGDISGGTIIEIIDPISMQIKNSTTIPYVCSSARNGYSNSSKIFISDSGNIVFHARIGNNSQAAYIIIDASTLQYSVVDTNLYSGTSDPFYPMKQAGINQALDIYLFGKSSPSIYIAPDYHNNNGIVFGSLNLGTGFISSTANKYTLQNSIFDGQAPGMFCSNGTDTVYFPSYGKNGSNVDERFIYLNKVDSFGLTECFAQIYYDATLNSRVNSLIYDNVSNKIFAVIFRFDSNTSYSTKLVKVDATTLTIDSTVNLDFPPNIVTDGTGKTTTTVSAYTVTPIFNLDPVNRSLVGQTLNNNNGNTASYYKSVTGNEWILGLFDKSKSNVVGFFINVGLDDLVVTRSPYLNDEFSGYATLSSIPRNCIYNKSKDAYTYTGVNYNQTNSRALILNSGMRVGLGTYPLADIVSDLCLKSGMTQDMIDISDINDIECRGFMRANQTTARSLLEALAVIYNFDGVESNTQFIFRKRGKPPVATITEDELGARFYTQNNSTSFDSIFKSQRVQEIDLPCRANIQYFDLSKDYAQNSQEAKRFISTTNNVMSIDAPVVLLSDEAKQIVKRIINQSWVSRETFQFETNYDYVYIEPGDVVTVNRPSVGVTHTIRIIKKDESQGIIKFEGQSEDASVYTQIAKGGTGSVSTQSVMVTSDTELHLLDIPIFSSSDDDIGVYAVVDKKTPSAKWSGAKVYKSDTQTGTFTSQATFMSYATCGTAQGVLQEGHYENEIDNMSSIIVNINNGELVSISEDDINNGGNLALIGNEMIQFMNAELKGTNQYELTGLMRGRFGTEQAQKIHQLNDLFILFNFNDGSIKRINKDDYMIGVQKYYKAVTMGKNVDDVTAFDFINNAVGKKPYSVVNVESGRNAIGDLFLQWEKRIRGQVIFGNTLDPVDPDGDSYEVDILNNGQVVRTLKTNNLNITYTNDLQIIDFGSVQSSIAVKIYKMSPIVGRGFEFSNSF